MIARLLRLLRLLELRFAQIELDGFGLVGNAKAAQRLAPKEARLRAELTAL